MDSTTTGESNGDLNLRERFRCTENIKVYTRRSRKKAPKTSKNNDTATTTEDPPENPNHTLTLSDPPFNHGSPVRTSPLHANETNSPSRRSADKDVQYQHHSQEDGRSADKDVQYQHHSQEDDCSNQNRILEASGNEAAELQNRDDCSPPPNSNSAHNSEPPEISCEGTQNLMESSLLSNETDPQNTEEAVAVQPLNGGELTPQVCDGNGPANVNRAEKPLVIYRVDDRIRFSLHSVTPKNEIREFQKKLKFELDQIRRLVKQLEAKELQLTSYDSQISNSNHCDSRNYISTESGNIGGYTNFQPPRVQINVVENRALMRANSEVGMVDRQDSRPMGLVRAISDVGASHNLEPRPYSRQLSVAVMENNHMASEFVEKEKRTPKANQYYRNSEFLLSKDRLPPESNKRSKMNNGRKHSVVTEQGFGFGLRDKSRNQVIRSCSNLLQKLMKHKYGWVFNEPVNAMALGLVDYHDVIEHPMDLGTIKTRLSQNWYKSPREFAEDVRLVFRNAMTYNPKGQDVHVMAEQLSQHFEERWAVLEAEYNNYWKYQDSMLSTPNSVKTRPHSHFAQASFPVSTPIPLYVPAAPQMRTMPFDPKIHRSHVGRTPVPKKPKAKDPNKRDMTYDEKQKLSTNLQSLSSEKLDAILQIIKKRNTALSQNDDEIEVDIDKVDPETLWELDRLVTNYKKSLSKRKRKAELALQARAGTNQTVSLTNTTPASTEVPIQSGTGFEKHTAPPAVEGENQRYNGGGSSSSSSSSSDSGSSSSDSDSDSSSEDGSDAAHSPGT